MGLLFFFSMRYYGLVEGIVACSRNPDLPKGVLDGKAGCMILSSV
jgi:hypothetical protein